MTILITRLKNAHLWRVLTNNCVSTNLFSPFDCIGLLKWLPQVSAQREQTISYNCPLMQNLKGAITNYHIKINLFNREAICPLWRHWSWLDTLIASWVHLYCTRWVSTCQITVTSSEEKISRRLWLCWRWRNWCWMQTGTVETVSAFCQTGKN